MKIKIGDMIDTDWLSWDNLKAEVMGFKRFNWDLSGLGGGILEHCEDAIICRYKRKDGTYEWAVGKIPKIRDDKEIAWIGGGVYYTVEDESWPDGLERDKRNSIDIPEAD